MHPHDYYAPYSDEPKLHNRGAARPYVEPDWQANAAGHQLPVLSTVGRGPRGEGLEVGNVVNTDDTVSFALYSTLTGELVWQSPNLAPSKIEFLPADFRDLAAGQAAPMDIKVTRGGITETTHAYLPCGEQGSLIYTLDEIVAKNSSQTYQTTVEDLIIYGNQHWNNGHKPMPKVNDIVLLKLSDGDNVVMAVGDIVQVGSKNEEEIGLDSPVVYVVRTMIDNVGPKGDKGDPGEPGKDATNNIKVVKFEIPIEIQQLNTPDEQSDLCYVPVVPSKQAFLEEQIWEDGYNVIPMLPHVAVIAAHVEVCAWDYNPVQNEFTGAPYEGAINQMLTVEWPIGFGVGSILEHVDEIHIMPPMTNPCFYQIFDETGENSELYGLWFNSPEFPLWAFGRTDPPQYYPGEDAPTMRHMPNAVVTLVYSLTYDEEDYESPIGLYDSTTIL